MSQWWQGGGAWVVQTGGEGERHAGYAHTEGERWNAAKRSVLHAACKSHRFSAPPEVPLVSVHRQAAITTASLGISDMYIPVS